jgi:hypothetical protein
MMSETMDAAGLAGLESSDDRAVTGCSGQPGTEADSWIVYYPLIEEQDARDLMRNVFNFWSSVAESWALDGYDVTDDGIDTKSTPAAQLNIDGFSLSATYFPGASVAAFQLAGTAPCV